MHTDVEMIAAAVAAGKVRRIPFGASGINPITLEPAPDGFTFGLPLNVPRSQVLEIDEIDIAIRKLWRDDMRYREIGDAVGIAPSAVCNRLKRLGLTGIRKAARR